MQSATQTIQQVRGTSRQESQDQKTPDTLDVLEQFGTTMVIRRGTKSMGRVSRQSGAGKSSPAVCAALG
jgi:hypothetical protein